MSSESAVVTTAWSRLTSFRWMVTATVAILVLAAAGLTTAIANKEPRLVGAEVNVAATVQRAAQRLILRTDQPVDVVADQVTVTPAAPIEVTSDQSAVVLRFSDMLAYATAYKIAVPVRGTATGVAATLTYVLQTPDAQLYLLQRTGTGPNVGTDDHIVRTVPGSNERQVVYRAPRIQAFAVAEPAMVVITQDGDDSSRLAVGTLDGSDLSTTTIADQALFTQLRSSGPGGLFGFVRSPRGFDPGLETRLELYDPSTGELTTAKGLGGGPLSVQDWYFVPGTRSVVVQAVDSSVYLINPTSNDAPVPLGSHGRMHGFAEGSSTLVVEDGDRYVFIDLTNGDSSVIPPFRLAKNETLDALLVPPGGRDFIGTGLRLNEDDMLFSVVRINEGQRRLLYAPDSAAIWIDKICLSPNSEYLAVQTVPAAAESDDYLPIPTFKQMSTVVVDLSTGDVVDEIPGFGSTWCT